MIWKLAIVLSFTVNFSSFATDWATILCSSDTISGPQNNSAAVTRIADTCIGKSVEYFVKKTLSDYQIQASNSDSNFGYWGKERLNQMMENLCGLRIDAPSANQKTLTETCQENITIRCSDSNTKIFMKDGSAIEVSRAVKSQKNSAVFYSASGNSHKLCDLEKNTDTTVNFATEPEKSASSYLKELLFGH